MLKQNVEYQEKDPSLASSLYLVEKTYIAKQVISMSRVIEGTVPSVSYTHLTLPTIYSV